MTNVSPRDASRAAPDSHAIAPTTYGSQHANRASHGPRTGRFRLLAVSLSLAGLAACGDTPSQPPATSPRLAEVVIAVPESPSTREAPTEARDSILQELQQEDARHAGFSAIQADVLVDGKRQRVSGARALHTLISRHAGGVDVKSTDASARSGAAMLGERALLADDSAAVTILFPASLVLSYPSRFDFRSYSAINKDDMARFTFSGVRSVSLDEGGSSISIWSATGSQTVATTGGYAVAVWPDFEISSGCSFKATLATSHGVDWPWGSAGSSFRQSHDVAQSGGYNELARDCSAAPTPPPSASEPICDDPSGFGCETMGGGSTIGSTGGIETSREYGRSAGYKTVCDVTDWYENGVYIETTVNRCWTVPIW